jgi:hypothetical protein
MGVLAGSEQRQRRLLALSRLPLQRPVEDRPRSTRVLDDLGRTLHVVDAQLEHYREQLSLRLVEAATRDPPVLSIRRVSGCRGWSSRRGRTFAIMD